MTNKHDDRLNKLEQWLETYGEDADTREEIRFVLNAVLQRVVGIISQATGAKTPNIAARTIKTTLALRDLANIVGIGLEDLEGP